MNENARLATFSLTTVYRKSHGNHLRASWHADPSTCSYLFKDEATKQQFLATRFHRRIAVPRKRISELRFEQNLDVLEPLMAVR